MEAFNLVKRREPSFPIWLAIQIERIPTAMWITVIWLEVIVIYLQNVRP